MQHLQSKTIIGLLVLLAVIIGLAWAGKLTPEAVDAIKWVGGSYMLVRSVANYSGPGAGPGAPPNAP